MSIFLLCFASLIAIFLVTRVDLDLLRRGVPALGFLVTSMYIVTYGLGLVLWRLDPSSLFGYGTASTIGSLNRLCFLFALGITALAAGYFMVRVLCKKNFLPPYSLCSFLDVAERNRSILQCLSIVLISLSVLALFGMISTGLFLRDPQKQQEALQLSLLAKFLIGTGWMSRIAPVALVLAPFAWKGWTLPQKFWVVLMISVWIAMAFASSSRGQLLAIPMYLFLGSVIWKRIQFRFAVVLCIVGVISFLPVAELIRINREGDVSNPALQKTFQPFQIGKQLMGTSHEFYLLLQSRDCRENLDSQILARPTLRKLLNSSPSELFPDSSERWHVVRMYESCSNRSLERRSFSSFERLPFGLIPKTIFPAAPTLFDGQNLAETISLQLDLRPGELSQGTLSIFADAWWRWRWSGVVVVSALLGATLAVFQMLLICLIKNRPIPGLLGQLLVLSLVGTWINNTILTMIWFLFWDLPKAWLELFFITLLLRLRLRMRTR